MRDPIDELSNLDPGADMNPLPPSEIRRRGDRMRRRNTVLMAAGTAAAVALIAVPTAMLGAAQRADDGMPDPAPSPTEPNPSVVDPTPSPTEDPTTGTETWPTRIPDGFPLDSGMREGGGDVRKTGPVHDLDEMGFEACGNKVIDFAPIDRLAVTVSDGSAGEHRELSLFRTENEAVTWAAHIKNLYQSCPRDDSNSQDAATDAVPPFVTHSVVDGPLGEDSFAVLTDSDSVHRSVTHVAWSGNAVLIQSAGDEAGATGDSQDLATVSRENLADVVAAMTDLVGGDTNEPSGAAQAGLSDSNLITAGQIPAPYGLTDYQQLPPYDGATIACQADWLTNLAAEQVKSREFGAYSTDAPVEQQIVPSAQVNTAVLRFADADAASAAYDTLKGWVSACDPRVDDRWIQAETSGGSAGGGGSSTADRSEWVTATFCGDSCEGTWFARMGYAQVGDRLVVVQVQEGGTPGPEPEIWDLDGAIETLMTAAVEKAAG